MNWLGVGRNTDYDRFDMAHRSNTVLRSEERPVENRIAMSLLELAWSNFEFSDVDVDESIAKSSEESPSGEEISDLALAAMVTDDDWRNLL
jgi:hypothetical protein